MSTIMLVDDSATILLSISSILSKAGYKVEKAPNAEEALKKFNNGTPVCCKVTSNAGKAKAKPDWGEPSCKP